MTSGERGDTIAAISTPVGTGGIGIVRLSGPRSLAIAERLFYRKGKGHPALLSRRFYTGEILHPSDGRILDEVLLVYMAAPKTYTREDVVEIQCHSGILVLQEILQHNRQLRACYVSCIAQVIARTDTGTFLGYRHLVIGYG